MGSFCCVNKSEGLAISLSCSSCSFKVCLNNNPVGFILYLRQMCSASRESHWFVSKGWINCACILWKQKNPCRCLQRCCFCKSEGDQCVHWLIRRRAVRLTSALCISCFHTVRVCRCRHVISVQVFVCVYVFSPAAGSFLYRQPACPCHTENMSRKAILI